MPNTDALNINQGVDKVKEGLSKGNYIQAQRYGESLTAGDSLLNKFDLEDPEVKESKGSVNDTKGIPISSAPSQFNPFNVFRYKPIYSRISKMLYQSLRLLSLI
jgi:hypothetical protein